MKIAIIGGGISGLMCAYRLCQDPDNTITIFEQGKNLEQRACPVLTNKSDKCIKCCKCDIMSGITGAGAFSDGKYNITTEFGGWLQDIIGSDTLLKYEYEVDDILTKFGSSSTFFEPNNSLKKECLQHGLYMLQSRCKHLGTDDNYRTMLNFVKFLEKQPNVTMVTNFPVLDVDLGNRVYSYSLDYEYSKDKFDKVVFAVGRAGSSMFLSWCRNHNIKLWNNQVDIGVRVELPAPIWQRFEETVYEPKILYKTQRYGDIVRMFCFNGRGEVVNENTDSILTVNGHAYNSELLKTDNTNFALLSTINFTEPFKEPIEYAKHVARLANMVSGGSVIIQTLGDLRRGRRTDYNRLHKCTTKPTLKSAVPGDLSLCMPKRQLDNIIEMLDKLNEIAPGTANDDTLLYGIECKYYSARPEVDENFLLFRKEDDLIFGNCYAIGDGAGFTRSLAQAAAHGLFLADKLMSDN